MLPTTRQCMRKITTIGEETKKKKKLSVVNKLDNLYKYLYVTHYMSARLRSEWYMLRVLGHKLI